MEGSLFAIFDLLIGPKSITLYFYDMERDDFLIKLHTKKCFCIFSITYVCARGRFFFFRSISSLKIVIFDGIFFISFKSYCCFKLKIETLVHP